MLAVSEVLKLAKGKGNKIQSIPPRRVKAGQESVAFIGCPHGKQKLVIHCGKKFKTMNLKKLEDYCIERGYQNDTDIEVID